MKGIRIFGWLIAAAGTVGVWAAFPVRPSERIPAGVSVVRDLAYGSAAGASLKLDLFLPAEEASDPPRPLVVAVHGGGWTGGSKRDYSAQFAPLVRSGLAVAVVDYRLARPGAPSWKGALDDVVQALDWLIRKADEFHLDPSRVAMIGTSSGGLLAARAAQEDPRIHAVVCLSTPSSLIDLAAERRQLYDPAVLFLGGEPARNPERAREASPLAHVASGGPAMLLIHGDEDAWVPLDQARRMHYELVKTGEVERFVEVQGARHGFELKVNTQPPRDLAPVVIEFLNQVWRGPAD